MRIALLGAVLIMAGGMLTACGGGSTLPPQVPEDQARRVAIHDQSEVSLSDGAATTAQGESTRTVEDGPYIMEMWLHPDPPLSNSDLRADPRVDNPAKGFLDVRYKWRVNGDELMGQSSDSLPAAEFDKGDVIEIEVTAKDVNGRTDAHRFQDIRVANSKPVVTSRIGAAGSLDGFQFEAKDPDGDKVSWRLDGAPQGVSIGRTSGIFKIAGGQRYDSGAYTISVVASDGDGGEGTLTFRAALSGGQRGQVEYQETEGGKVVSGNSVSEKEYLDRTEQLVDKMDDMSDEELQEFLDRSVTDRELEAAVASEVGEEVTLTPLAPSE